MELSSDPTEETLNSRWQPIGWKREDGYRPLEDVPFQATGLRTDMSSNLLLLH